jgi:Cytochrome c oxidase assembly protein COX16
LWYQVKLRKSPFLFFGLPFLTIIIGGSFALSSFTTIRYERHNRKIKLMTEEEALKLDKDRRRPDIREEYNVRLLSFTDTATARERFRQLGTKASDSSER